MTTKKDWKALKKFVREIERDGGYEHVVHPSTAEEKIGIRAAASSILAEMKRMDGTADICDCCGRKLPKARA